MDERFETISTNLHETRALIVNNIKLLR